MHHARRPARARLLAVLAAAAVFAAACGGGGDGGDDAGGDDGTTTTLAPVPAPLTGIVVQDGAIAKRPVVTVKVDNGPEGRPQSGLDKADVLIEEKVEGGITRFLAVFHSEDSSFVGPVRSVRSTDANIVAALGGVFAFAGGIPDFEKLARQQPVTVVSEAASAEGFQYPANKRRPFKTYTDTTKLRSMIDKGEKAPPKLFQFLAAGEAFNPAGAAPATGANVAFAPRSQFAVAWDGATSTWKRTTNATPHAIENGAPLAFANVIIQRIAYTPTRFKDPSGAVVDEADVVGSGDAIVLSQGKQATVKWSKPSPTAVTTYTDAAGQPLKLTPGRTLVALPPSNAAVTVT